MASIGMSAVLLQSCCNEKNQYEWTDEGWKLSVKDRVNKDMMAYYQIPIHVSYEDVQLLKSFVDECGLYKDVTDFLTEYTNVKVKDFIKTRKGEE
jgi:hypothetical protein